MSGLEERQLDELEEGVAELLQEPWDKSTGRPREITFREALVITCGYMRQNIIEDVWADIFDVDQSTISRIITFLTPLVEQATAEFRPAPEEAAEATGGAVALVGGTLWPCWSWDGERELWSGKYKTTGHGSLIVTNLQGRITFVSEPLPFLSPLPCYLVFDVAVYIIGIMEWNDMAEYFAAARNSLPSGVSCRT
jgi:Helix-turn-helix of DDE superfamily endonuclease